MNVKLLNLIIKAVIILFLIKYTFVIENLMKGDLLTIVSVILIGYYVNNIIPYIEEQFELKDVELTADTEIKAEAESVVTTIDNVSEEVANEVTNEVTNDIKQDAEIVLNEIAPSASEQMAPHKDNQMKQLNPAKITNDVTIQNLNNENVQSLEDTVKEITESTNGQCQIGQQIDSATGKCVAITVKTDDNNAVAINVVPTTPDLSLDVTDNTDGKLTAQETVDLLEEDARKKQI